jgi:hypothetical protein
MAARQWCAAEPGPFQSLPVPHLRRTAKSAFTRVFDALGALHRARDTVNAAKRRRSGGFRALRNAATPNGAFRNP